MLEHIARLNNSPYFWRGVARGMGYAFALAFSTDVAFWGNYVFAVVTLFGCVVAAKYELDFDRIIMHLETDDKSEGT
jgi:hypothetical protein